MNKTLNYKKRIYIYKDYMKEWKNKINYKMKRI